MNFMSGLDIHQTQKNGLDLNIENPKIQIFKSKILSFYVNIQ